MSWRVLFMHEMPVALALALDRVGKSIPARIAMMAMTTSNSIKVNAPRRFRRGSAFSDEAVFVEFIGTIVSTPFCHGNNLFLTLVEECARPEMWSSRNVGGKVRWCQGRVDRFKFPRNTQG